MHVRILLEITQLSLPERGADTGMRVPLREMSSKQPSGDSGVIELAAAVAGATEADR